MSLYLLFLLWAYSILKPVSPEMFLDNFEIDKIAISVRSILIAAVGGILAYLRTKIAVKTSLEAAAWATGLLAACLVAIWWSLAS